MCALNLRHYPENGKVWVPAGRGGLRASHASVHTMDSDGRAPGVSDSIESNNRNGASLACRTPLGQWGPSMNAQRNRSGSNGVCVAGRGLV